MSSDDITKGVDTATSVFTSIPEFMKAFNSVIETPYGWLLLLGILVWVFLNKNFFRLLNLFEAKEKKRLDELEVYVSNKEAANNETLEVIKDVRDAHYFKVATDIYAEKHLRDSLIGLYKKTPHTINWVNIKRAMPYIEVNSNSNISIREQTFLEKIGYFYNLFIGLLFLGLSILLSLSLTFILLNNKELIQLVVLIITILFCTLFTVFIFSQNFPVRSAKKIKAALNKANSTSSTVDETDNKP